MAERMSELLTEVVAPLSDATKRSLREGLELAFVPRF